ncbi:MAG TPA: DUF4386 family protein [Anaerolineales bacterium]|nr:DUF4386 family protein [Anaerolineales bacterium]
MKTPNPQPEMENADSVWKPIYRVGAWSAMIAALIFRRNLDAEWFLFRAMEIVKDGPMAPPSTVLDWFVLLQSNKLLGLTLLKVFDMVNYLLVGFIFFALYAALRKVNKPLVTLAVALTALGIGIYLASNQAFTMLSLSNQYTASTDAQRAMLQMAGQAVLAIHYNDNYPGVYLSYLFVTVAGLVFSTVMLRCDIFSRPTAYAGILANGFGLGYYVTLAFASAFEFIPISISAVFLLIWYLLVGLRLFQLGQVSRTGAK